MKKKSPAVFWALAVAVIVGWAWWQGRSPDDSGALVLHGNVDIRQVALAFEGDGRVTALRAEEGDRVKVGALLATLDTRTLALQADQAAAQIAVQEQTLLRLRNGSRPQEIAQARNQLKARQADAVRAQLDFSRLQGIATNTAGRGVSVQDLDRARSTLQVAQAQVAEQQEALRLVELGPRVEEVEGAKAQLEASKAELALLLHKIDQGQLHAPADAVVRSRLLEPGDMAGPQRPVFALALDHPKWVRLYVSERDLGKVKPGMAAEVITDSHSEQPVQGKVGYISSVAEFTPKAVETEELRTRLVYEVRVVVEDAADALRLGQPATVRLAGGE
jgi:HlyD family secretion protein